METIKIIEEKGKVCTVGHIFKGKFYKKVSKNKHLHYKTNSWGIDAEAFNKIIFLECSEIKILDEDENTLYECSVSYFKTYGQYLHFKPHRAQIFLNREKFKITKNYE